MLILFVASKYDYGRPEQGHSYEYYNFYDSLLHMGHDIIYFDYLSLIQKYGRNRMNKLLLDIVTTESPDLMFTVLLKDELDPRAIQKISNSNTITLNWFCDDRWRFDNYSKYWAPRFNWIVTTDQTAIPKYAELNYHNVIKSQWACNHFMYRKLNLPLKYNVTFVGYPHGTRRETIKTLHKSGINARVWGTDWKLGHLPQEELICVFNQSRVNLNLSNASTTLEIPGRLSRFLSNIPFGMSIKRKGTQWLSTIRSLSKFQYQGQIKGRNFEVPGCGGFLLSERVEGLEDYYNIGKEVECFDDMNSLIEKIHYYLSHEDERSTIALAGYKRTLLEHTYAHRFTDIFKQLRLPHESLSNILKGNVLLGRTKEVEQK